MFSAEFGGWGESTIKLCVSSYFKSKILLAKTIASLIRLSTNIPDEPEKSFHFGKFITPRLIHGFESFKF